MSLAPVRPPRRARFWGHLTRRQGALRTLAAGGAFFSVVFGDAASGRAAEADPQAFSRLYFGLQLASDRDAQRAVELAEELLADGRAGEAAPLVARLFASDSDSVDDRGASLRQRMLTAIRQAKGRVAPLRAVLAAQHRRELQEARDAAALRRHLAAYPPELFGGDALRRLGRLEEDAGRYAQAAVAYGSALEVARSEGDNELARQLMELVAFQRVRGGGELSAEESPSLDAAVMEATRAARAEVEQRQPPAAWLGAAGGPARNATAPGAPPRAWREWRAVVGDSVVLDQSERDAASEPRDAVLIEGVVVVSTDEGLVALDAATGRKQWIAPFPPSTPAWRGDGNVEGLSSDALRVYAVTPSGDPNADPEPRLRRRFGESLFRGDEPAATPNRLAAYDPATSGKLLWELDGGDAAGPLAGTRFLGPPAAREGLLYVAAEQEQTIRLLEIDAATGEVRWSQPLVRCERESPEASHSLSVEPTLGERLVYCPTGRGAIAAVDPLLRRLRWVAYLAVDEADARPLSQNGWGAVRSFGYGGDEGPTWRRCRMKLEGEALVVASPELAELQAFDAATGAVKWRRETPDGRFLGRVGAEGVLTLHDGHATLWSLADGKPLSKAKLPEGDSPVGEGLVLGDRYLAPLRSGRLAVLAIDSQASGLTLDKLIDPRVNPWAEPPRLGNLAYHRGAVLSVSTATVECFQQPGEQSAPLDEALAALAAGDAARAAALLEPLASRPEADGAHREAYAVARLASARAEGSLAAEVGAELPRLAAGRDVQASAAALRLAAAAARDDGDAVVAEARRVVADASVASAVLTLEPGWQVVTRRYAAERLRRFGAGVELLTEIAGAPPANAPEPFSGEDQMTSAGSLWTLRQVTADVSEALGGVASGGRTFRGNRDTGARIRRVGFVGWSAASAPASWTLESRGGEWLLVGATPQGDRAFVATLPSDPWVNVVPTGNDIGEPGHRRWGEWHALRQESGCLVVQAPGGIAWESAGLATSGWPPLPSSHPGAECPVAVGAWGVVTWVEGLLACRDLATGALVWRREIAVDKDGACRFLGVDDELFVARGDKPGLRLSAWSGQQLGGPWDGGNPRQWRYTAGANLLSEARTPEGRRFELRGIATASGEEPPTWDRLIPPGTLVAWSGNLAYFLEDATKLTAFDVAAGTERFTVTLPPGGEEPVRSLRVRERLGRLLVEIDRSNPVVDRLRGAGAVGEDPLLTGELHCLDPRTGQPLWARPAEVDGMAMIDAGGASAAVVLLARRRAPTSSDERAEALYALVALDLATGGTLYRNHALPAGDEQEGPAPLAAYHEYVGSPGAPTERLLVRIGRSWVTLDTTALPASPRPVSLARVEDPEASRPQGTRELGQGVERLLESLWEGDDD